MSPESLVGDTLQSSCFGTSKRANNILKHTHHANTHSKAFLEVLCVQHTYMYAYMQHKDIVMGSWMSDDMAEGGYGMMIRGSQLHGDGAQVFNNARGYPVAYAGMFVCVYVSV
jgi:hypothetical protein